MGLSTLEIEGYLSKNLRDVRFKHCQRVAALLHEVCGIYGLDPEQARLCGYLHDIAKQFPETTLLAQLAKKDMTTLQLLPEQCRISIYMHGPVGSLMLQEKPWEITDRSVLEAVRQHTWSFVRRTTLSRCLAVADIIERVDKSDGDGDLKKSFLEGSLDKAELLMLTFGLEHYRNKGFPIHPDTFLRRQELKNQLGLNSSQLTRNPSEIPSI